jgi:ubiquinone/menaquinone biosynthesis C-methylase UbiE/uncharacterized protein YbaR (Trm112 family)
MQKSIEQILLCPISKEPLTYTDKIQSLNVPIQQLANTDFTEGYLNASQTIFYPVLHGIICMLPDYAISDTPYNPDKDIQSVREFYDSFGWKKDEKEKYYDDALFIDQREVAAEYKARCTSRINDHLQKKGNYLLDIASGPVYQDIYKQFAKNFECRICIDISIEALKEAQKNLKDYPAVFLLGDITNIPLKNESCSNVVSMHTLYHVPKDKQAVAVHELVRVCEVDSDVLIAYNWGWQSFLMNITLFPSRFLRLIRRLKKIYRPKTTNKKSEAGLYFFSHSYRYFQRIKPTNSKVRFTVLRSLHENFIKLYLGHNKRSENFIRWIEKMEHKAPCFSWQTRWLRPHLVPQNRS